VWAQRSSSPPMMLGCTITARVVVMMHAPESCFAVACPHLDSCCVTAVDSACCSLLHFAAAFLTQTVPLNDGTVKFEIWDTAGQGAPPPLATAAAVVTVHVRVCVARSLSHTADARARVFGEQSGTGLSHPCTTVAPPRPWSCTT
jgi:hypothetical protein